MLIIRSTGRAGANTEKLAHAISSTFKITSSLVLQKEKPAESQQKTTHKKN